MGHPDSEFQGSRWPHLGDREVARSLKTDAARNLTIGGPALAAQALRAGLVDEIRLFLNPIVVGRGNAALPDDVPIPLALVDERRFGNRVVYVRYRIG